MKRIIHPFIGENYKTEGLYGTKILIMGESGYKKPDTYTPDYDISRHTQYGADDAIGYEDTGYWNRSRFYTRMARIFGFDTRSIVSRRVFWNSVSYYNFLQVILPAARVLPQAERWQEAQQPFLQTLEDLRPDYVVCFSMRMWPHLPKDADNDIPNAAGIFAKSASLQCSDQSSVQFLGFKHPTAPGFRWQAVKAIVDGQLKLTSK